MGQISKCRIHCAEFATKNLDQHHGKDKAKENRRNPQSPASILHANPHSSLGGAVASVQVTELIRNPILAVEFGQNTDGSGLEGGGD